MRPATCATRGAAAAFAAAVSLALAWIGPAAAAAAAGAAPEPVAAAAIDALATVRRQGCAGRPGLRAPLLRSVLLDRAARELGAGASLEAALVAAAYDSRASSSLVLPAPPTNLSLEAILRERFCATVMDPAWAEVGVDVRGRAIRIVLSDPIRLPTEQDAAAIRREVLGHVNAARASPRRCGSALHAAAPALAASAALDAIAAGHARAMAAGAAFEHTGPDGRTPAQRVADGGYVARISGENLALGPTTAAEVVAGWLDSPAHCANVMDARFAEMGIAFAVSARPAARVFWTQLLATPRDAAAAR